MAEKSEKFTDMNRRISWLKKIDKRLGPVLLRFIPGVKPGVCPETVKKILVIRPGGMGDAALLVPVLKMIKNNHPAIHMDILCEQRNEGIFQALSFVDHVFNYQKLGHIMRLMRLEYDLIVDTEQSHFLSAVVCRFLKGSYTLGYKANDRERMFHHGENYSHDIYEADMFLTLFRNCFDLPGTLEWDEPLFKPLGKRAERNVQAICSQVKETICFFPGATIEERLWPEERWAKLIDYFSGLGFQCILLGGRLEIEQCQKILSLCSNQSVINMSGKLSLLETAWLFKQSRLLVSTDSGILHLGVICNLSTVSLFGSGIKKKWGPKGEQHIILSLDLPCCPCTVYGDTPSCPHANRCMVELQAEMVINSFEAWGNVNQ